MLSIRNLDVFYGSLQALRGINIDIGEGSIVAIVGANGAGKSTLLKTISGLIKAKAGSIEFNGQRIDHLPPNKIVDAGISQVAEGRQLFPEMTVLENLEMGAYSSKARPYLAQTLGEVYELLPKLRDREKQMAGTLSGGEQQMVAIGRALMARPRMLILDEPSLGLAPKVVSTVFETIQRISDRGTTVMLVEQNLVKSLKMADYGYILENGSVSFEGKAETVLNDSHAKEAYLGM